MHIITRSKLVQFVADNPRFADAEAPLDRWYRTTKRAKWSSFAALRADFAHADFVAPFVVFNIGGNKYRLIAHIYFADQVVLVRYILTHADYDQGAWRE